MTDKLTKLREQMKRHNLDAYIITSADDHQSEYVTGYWHARAWLSGFDGSSGLLAVLDDEAALWTDGRYFLQAEKQLAGSGITLMKSDEPGVPAYYDWLAKKLPPGGVLGFDGRTLGLRDFEKLEKLDIRCSYENDLVNEIWADRPEQFGNKPGYHKESGRTTADKLAEVREKMKEKKATHYVVASLDSIAWLFNIRGNDIPQTPVVYAYAVVEMDTARIFIPDGKFEAVEGAEIYPYDAVYGYLQNLQRGTLIYDPGAVSVKLAGAIPASVIKQPEEEDIIALLKAVKNPVEIADIRNAHIKEGVVMTRFLKWLDESTHKFPETAVHEKLTELREQQDGYLEPSFDTIAGYMSNGAIVHYSPKQDECAEVKREGFLLVDTGAQYNDGTTDITRTAVMGEITDEMKHDFTIVLKGHIALATAVFLKGTVGGQLDVLARGPFWREGLNYRHGTGHGIGYCLGVHEGPHHISMRPGGAKLAPGMLVTNEPGLYRDGKYGIRTENVMLIEERYTNEFGTFLGFETLSLCPIDLRAVDLTLLNAKEKDWLNAYHKKVYDLLSPRLTPDESEWLKQVTVAVILN